MNGQRLDLTQCQGSLVLEIKRVKLSGIVETGVRDDHQVLIIQTVLDCQIFRIILLNFWILKLNLLM